MTCQHKWMVDDFGPDVCELCHAQRPNSMTSRGDALPKLLPCPFCGEAGGIAGHNNEHGAVYYVKCDVCESEGPGDSVELDAIARWNNRAMSAAPPAEVMGEVLELVKYYGWQNDGRWQTPALKNLYFAIAALARRPAPQAEGHTINATITFPGRAPVLPVPKDDKPMTPTPAEPVDHEAAKQQADDILSGRPYFTAVANLARAYLDLRAQLAEAQTQRHAFALELRLVQDALFAKLDALKAAEARATASEASRAAMREVLEWLDDRGSLGYAAHDRIRAVIGRPPGPWNALSAGAQPGEDKP